MDKRKVFLLIFLCFLVTSSLCREKPNHLFAESSSEVIGFKNPSARHADVPLRSGQHKIRVQTSTTTDSFSSDVERIGSLDGRVLPASKDAQKSIKWTKDDKIKNVSTMRKLKFAMRRSARRHNVFKSSHGTGMPSSASILKDSKDMEAFAFQKTPPSFITSLQYKAKITAPFKLAILPTEETATPSVDKADAESDDKIKNVSTMRKLKFAMRRAARRHNVLKSSHGTGMPSSASILKDSKDMEAFAFQKTPPSFITSLQYKAKITAPFKLAILPTEETAIPSVNKADAESDWLLKEDNTTEQDDQKSSHGNDEEDNFSQHGESKVDGHEGSTRLAGTSAMPKHKMSVHPGVKAPSDKDMEAFAFQKTPPSSITSLQYKAKITAPFKLAILPTEETAIPSVNKADAESDWLLKEDNTTEQDDQKSSHGNDEEDNFSQHGESKVDGHEGSTRLAGTSAMPKHKMSVHPGVKAPSDKDMEAFAFQKTPPSSITSLQYKAKITAPFKLAISPTEETAIPSVNKADAESDWLLKEDNTTEQDDKKSSHGNDEEDNFSQHGESKVNGQEGSTRLAGTSAMPKHKMSVHPGVKASSGLRWKAAYDHVKLDDSKKGKHFKYKKKKSHSEDEEPVPSSTPEATVVGILTGILVLLFIFNGVPRLWRIFKKRWRRRRYNGENVPNFHSAGYFSEELSEEEIIFDRTAMRRNKDTGPVLTPTTFPKSHSASSSQWPGHPTPQQEIWTLTETPTSTPLMAVPTLDDWSRTEVWMANETPETKSLDTSFTTSSLSDLSTGKLTETPRSVSLTSVSLISLASVTEMCDPNLAIETRSSAPVFDLADKTVPSPIPFSTQPTLSPSTISEHTPSQSSLSSHPSKPSLSLLPTASNESTLSISMASDGTSPSTESCKTPVAARNEVVITLDDDDQKIIHPSDKSVSVVSRVVEKNEHTSSQSSLSSHPSKPSLSLLPTASNESTPSISLASNGTSFSTESCNIPVDARNEVVITLDDDGEKIIHPSDKSGSVLSSVVRNNEHTSSKSSLPSHPSKPSLSLLPTASNESTPSISLASDGTSSSTESCNIPVDARNEVVITLDDDGEKIIHPSDKSGSVLSSVVKNNEHTSSKSSLPSHPSKPSLSLLPTASDESTPSISMASDGTSSSTESYKTPVAAGNEVMITLDGDDEKIIQPSDKSVSVGSSVVKNDEHTSFKSSLLPHPFKPSLALLPTASDESTPSISMASDGTSSSTESYKTPVAARNEVMITLDDDDEKIIHPSDKSGSKVSSVVKDADKESSKQHVVITMGLDDDEEPSVIPEFESESSPGEMIYTSQESEMRDVTTRDAIIDIMGSDNTNEETSRENKKSNQDETPLVTLPTIPTPTASTELPQGKSLIGGRKALENRRFIKHLISEQDSTGFRSDLNAAFSRILGEKKNLADKNKKKRTVIKHQTQETKHTLAESILRAKSMIMDENVDRERNKRSSMRRKLIQHPLKYPGRPTQTLAQEIAFAKDIILLGHAHPRDAARPKAKREVRREDESMASLDRGASTSNSAKIRVLNHKDYKTWKAIQKDIKMKKAQGLKPRDVLSGLQTIRDIYNLPRIPVDSEGGCLCYYCEKHIKRAQRKKFFKLPSKLFSFKSKSSSTKESHSDSEGSSFTSSAAAGPSTSSAANFDSGLPNNRFAC